MAERKKYIDVQVPILNETMRVLGTPETLNNKTIKLDLTRKLRGKGLVIKLRIFNSDGKLIAVPNCMELVTAYLRRMMRKRADYVEDSFQTKCADLKVTIKPLLITRKKVSRVVRKNLRNTSKEFLIEYIKEKEYLNICDEILEGTLQKAMLPKLKKVYPLSFCDIRIFETKEPEKIDLKKASAIQEIADIQEIPEEESENIQEIPEEETEDIQGEEAEDEKNINKKETIIEQNENK